jgi:hypothetical protein
MQQQLHMEILSFNRLILLILVSFLLSSFDDQETHPIDIEKVRKDILGSSDNIIPDKYISSLRKNRFLVIYSKEHCFVHVAYKSFSSESQMKQSVVAVYKLLNGSWVFAKLLPYYYNIELIDAKSNVFLSENQECGLAGDCNSFTEITVFRENDFVPLIEYSGIDRTVYLINEFNESGQKNIIQYVGDTIAINYSLKEFSIVSDKDFSYKLLREGVILKNISDSLGITGFSKSMIIKVKR